MHLFTLLLDGITYGTQIRRRLPNAARIQITISIMTGRLPRMGTPHQRFPVCPFLSLPHLLKPRRRRVHEVEGMRRRIRFPLAPGHVLVSYSIALSHELLVGDFLVLLSLGIFLFGLPNLLLIPGSSRMPVRFCCRENVVFGRERYHGSSAVRSEWLKGSTRHRMGHLDSGISF